jgi:hypothetical protein
MRHRDCPNHYLETTGAIGPKRSVPLFAELPTQPLVTALRQHAEFPAERHGRRRTGEFKRDNRTRECHHRSTELPSAATIASATLARPSRTWLRGAKPVRESSTPRKPMIRLREHGHSCPPQFVERRDRGDGILFEAATSLNGQLVPFSREAPRRDAHEVDRLGDVFDFLLGHGATLTKRGSQKSRDKGRT